MKLPRHARFSAELSDAYAYVLGNGRRQTTSGELLLGLIDASPGFRRALMDFGVDVAELERDVADGMLAGQARRPSRELGRVLARASAGVIDAGGREVLVADVIRAIAEEPASAAHQALVRQAMRAEDLRAIADRLGA